MLRLRPYRESDAKTIISWIKDEREFYRWSAGRLGDYPVTAEKFNELSELMAFVAIDDSVPVGFFTMRVLDGDLNALRFGFVIVDAKKRGHSYGKGMLTLGLKYAEEIFVAKTVSIGVFENNTPALNCYFSLGFERDLSAEPLKYTFLSEEWDCVTLQKSL